MPRKDKSWLETSENFSFPRQEELRKEMLLYSFSRRKHYFAHLLLLSSEPSFTVKLLLFPAFSRFLASQLIKEATGFRDGSGPTPFATIHSLFLQTYIIKLWKIRTVQKHHTDGIF